ncbi:FAD:protein FMN transferase [Aliiglaciecola sp. CAU 1673]|uniref:FAD:protein FMN transferase n=1 Tax=Aliiglaciecola sp. CAU 1673 TaxID=3032595 RepID=UPI0023DB2DC3|nr:FAD:protein FMN transferase [Aliiglaciecola sp. CAU 1673]MDF2177273.1 FAD:protein FMN transferase [Aliiglaciecola sp. CAU 1673]
MQDLSSSLAWRGDHFCGRFRAMASPCELLIDCQDEILARRILDSAISETRRIEQKYSRYLPDNMMAQINNGQGQPVAIDDETYRLLQFANTCYELSDGLFDITSGVLRRAWKFDGSDRLSSAEKVQALLPLIGWHKVNLDEKTLSMPPGFELDFGGIGKEYAVDAVAKLAMQIAPKHSVLVNFGGDIQVTQPRAAQQPWQIGIEDPNRDDHALKLIQIRHGGLATSGDARRFLLKNGIRYGHILNPKTGYPIVGAPRSVTVAAEHCIQAGMLATLALLQGPDAKDFLEAQGVCYWICE